MRVLVQHYVSVSLWFVLSVDTAVTLIDLLQILIVLLSTTGHSRL